MSFLDITSVCVRDKQPYKVFQKDGFNYWVFSSGFAEPFSEHELLDYLLKIGLRPQSQYNYFRGSGDVVFKQIMEGPLERELRETIELLSQINVEKLRGGHSEKVY